MDNNSSWHQFQHMRLVFSSPLWHSTPRVSRGIEMGHEANQMNNWLLWRLKWAPRVRRMSKCLRAKDNTRQLLVSNYVRNNRLMLVSRHTLQILFIPFPVTISTWTPRQPQCQLFLTIRYENCSRGRRHKYVEYITSHSEHDKNKHTQILWYCIIYYNNKKSYNVTV